MAKGLKKIRRTAPEIDEMEDEGSDETIGTESKADQLYNEAIKSDSASSKERVQKLRIALRKYRKYGDQKSALKCQGQIARIEAQNLWDSAEGVGGEKELGIRVAAVGKTSEAIRFFEKAELPWLKGVWEIKRYKWSGIIANHKGDYKTAKTSFLGGRDLSIRTKDKNSEIWCTANLKEIEGWELVSLRYSKGKRETGFQRIAKAFEDSENLYKEAGDEKSRQYMCGFKSLFLFFDNPRAKNYHLYEEFERNIDISSLEVGGSGRRQLKLHTVYAAESLKQAIYRDVIFNKFRVLIENLETWLIEQRKKIRNKWLFDGVSVAIDRNITAFSLHSGTAIPGNLDWAVKLNFRNKHKIPEEAQARGVSEEEIADEHVEEVFNKKDAVLRILPLEISAFKKSIELWVETEM